MQKPSRRLAGAAALCLFSSAAVAAEPKTSSERPIEEVFVTAGASRLPASLLSFPGSVTLISAEDIRSANDIDNDPAKLLSQQVPGLGTASPASASNFEQTLRGRKAAILIDGVPIGTPLRDGRHDVRSLSLTAVESIEVIRGATALYGNGGVGGVINYITRKPADGEWRYLTEVGTGFSLTNVGDSASPFFHQAASGASGDTDFVFDGYARQTNTYYDADSDPIRPSPQGQGGIADSDIYNLYGKVGHDFGKQRIAASILYYDQEQDSEFNTVIPGDASAGIKTRVGKGPGNPAAENPSNTNLVANLVYSHGDVLGSELRTQVFYQEFENVFDFSESFFPGGGQSTIDAEKMGGRLDIETPLRFDFLAGDGTLLWGLDFLIDETAQPLVDGRTWAPEVEQTSKAAFVQANLPLTQRLNVSGGARQEDIDVEFPSFTALFTGERVPAGEEDYDATTLNVGASYRLMKPLALYASYSEGFSVAEVGRLLRQATEMTDFAEADLEASEVENYELGLRYESQRLSASVAAFESKSNLGTSITNDLRIARQKEETRGLEASIDAQLLRDWRVGGTLTIVKGRRDSDGDGRLDRDLASNVVPPPKLTAFVEHRFSDMWSARLQALHSDERDEFDTVMAFGEAPIESFTVVDASVKADFQHYGAVTLAVRNLFNEDYFPVGSQLFNPCCDDRFSKAPGTSAKLTYSISY